LAHLLARLRANRPIITYLSTLNPSSNAQFVHRQSSILEKMPFPPPSPPLVPDQCLDLHLSVYEFRVAMMLARAIAQGHLDAGRCVVLE